VGCEFLLVVLVGASRVAESVLPALSYGPSCFSTVSLQNLGDRPVRVDVEGHRTSGALVALAGQEGMTVQLAPGEAGNYRLQIDEGDAWVRVREYIPAADLSPVVAVAGATECVVGNELHTARREVAYPTRNPWFSADAAKVRGETILLINVHEHAARAKLCYSVADAEFKPVCSNDDDVQIPPFGSRQFLIDADPHARVTLRTRGDHIVLQMLKPVKPGVRVYTVDSTIKFGDELPPGR